MQSHGISLHPDTAKPCSAMNQLG